MFHFIMPLNTEQKEFALSLYEFLIGIDYDNKDAYIIHMENNPKLEEIASSLITPFDSYLEDQDQLKIICESGEYGVTIRDSNDEYANADNATTFVKIILENFDMDDVITFNDIICDVVGIFTITKSSISCEVG
jgi:hypothetical protein